MTDASKPFRDYVRQLAEFGKKFLNMNPYIFLTPPAIVSSGTTMEGNPMQRRLTGVALTTLLFGMLTHPALAQSPPSAAIEAVSSQVNQGEDVEFKAYLSLTPSHAVVIRVRWAGHDRYWRLQPDFDFSFPCDAVNQGQHTITIETADTVANQATQGAANNGNAGSGPYPTAYSVGSPSSATATCNATR